MTTIDAPVAPSPRLFDSDGRRVAINLVAKAHGTVRRRFICNQPAIDYAMIHSRISRNLGGADAVSPMEFKQRAEGILERLHADERCASLANAVAVPFFLPKMEDAATRDLGSDLEQIFLPAVERSFRERFPDRHFVNQHKAGLAGKLAVASGSRHDHLLRSMERGTIVGFVFVSLTEFSIPAAIEQLDALPPHILLTGGADLSAAFIGSPDLLLRTDGYPPLIWLAGLSAEAVTAAYHFEAYGYDLNFNRRVHFGQAAEYWSCALTITD